MLRARCRDLYLHRETEMEMLDAYYIRSAKNFYEKCAQSANPLVTSLGNYDPNEVHKYKRPKCILAERPP